MRMNRNLKIIGLQVQHLQATHYLYNLTHPGHMFQNWVKGSFSSRTWTVQGSNFLYLFQLYSHFSSENYSKESSFTTPLHTLSQNSVSNKQAKVHYSMILNYCNQQKQTHSPYPSLNSTKQTQHTKNHISIIKNRQWWVIKTIKVT